MLNEKWHDVVFWIGWEVRARRERLWTSSGLWVAHRLPRWIRYWVTIDSIAKATTGKYGNTVVPGLRAMDVLSRI